MPGVMSVNPATAHIGSHTTLTSTPWSFSWSFREEYCTPLVIGSTLDHCACTRLCTQSLPLCTALDLQLSNSALHPLHFNSA
ncbi:hypothetical protein F511_05319 [Dorcoceras hygrometricum]|uniref:Uncharacterized protein n=1 Tax=Dorcoceras hygrometricum TaxID=472368 RepID=A0A2Z7CY99_9LAMI|nr:hypothetical protein F511_05319 [Dorcoceras hygrometricum]